MQIVRRFAGIPKVDNVISSEKPQVDGLIFRCLLCPTRQNVSQSVQVPATARYARRVRRSRTSLTSEITQNACGSTALIISRMAQSLRRGITQSTALLSAWV